MTTMVKDAATGRCRSGDVEIFYRRFGSAGKTPIVIMHGLSYFSYDWIEPAQRLAADREVAAMDMRGFGDSSWARDYSIAANAADVIALLDHLKWPKAVLVAHSMGGRHCTFCAAKHPDRVAALVLVDYTPENAPAGAKRVTETVGRTPDSFPTIDDAMKYYGTDPHSTAGAAKRERFEAYIKPVPGGFAVKRDPHFRNQFRTILEGGERPKLGVDMWTTLGEVKCPILSIRGTRSDMFAADGAPRIKAANPRIKLVEIGAGHNVAAENLDDFLRETRAFLAEQGV